MNVFHPQPKICTGLSKMVSIIRNIFKNPSVILINRFFFNLMWRNIYYYAISVPKVKGIYLYISSKIGCEIVIVGGISPR
jgi:hypothetical protein